MSFNMWPREKPVDSALLSKLVLLARGDVALVNAAVRAFQRNGEPIPLKDVVEYISAHRTRPNPAPASNAP